MGTVLLPAPPRAAHGCYQTRRNHVWLRASGARSNTPSGSVLVLFWHLLLAMVGDGTPEDIPVSPAMVRALSTLHYFFSVLVLTEPSPLFLLSCRFPGFPSSTEAGEQPFQSHRLTSSISWCSWKAPGATNTSRWGSSPVLSNTHSP